MDADRWLDLAVAACDHAGLRTGSIETLVTWEQPHCANAVYRLAGPGLDGRCYLKLFGPAAQRQFYVEQAVLQTLAGQPAIPAPRVVAAGERTEAPPYLILTEIAGATAEAVWDNLSRGEQLAIACQLGTITAAIHRLPQHALAAVEAEHGGRRAHIRVEQARRLAAIKGTENVSSPRRAAMIRFLQREAPAHLDQGPRLAHCELAHNHIYLARTRGAWQVSGFIDWADAMVGPPEWDVAFLWLWTFSRDREAMCACLRTFYAGQPRPARLARRCLAAILHTHSGPALWAEFVARDRGTEPIARAMTAYLFPPDVFGPPD